MHAGAQHFSLDFLALLAIVVIVVAYNENEIHFHLAYI
jgi:hypothetical protein